MGPNKPTKPSWKLDEAIGRIDDSLIEEANLRRAEGVLAAKRRRGVLLAAACLIAILVLSGVYMGMGNRGQKAADGAIELSNRSQRVTATYVSVVPNPETATGTGSAIAWHTEDEEFENIVGTLDAAAFRGTVTGIESIKLASDDGATDYRSIVSIRVDEPIRGECSAGETVRVLSPVPLEDGWGVEDNDVLELLRVGTEGVFMPVPYSENDTENLGEGRICLQDLAPYGFPNGICYAIVDNDGSLAHCDSMSGLQGSRSLAEAVTYVKDMIARVES